MPLEPEHDRLLILRVLKHGDANLIIHALQPNGNKVGLFAKSALKSKKRFGGGVLESGNFVKASYRLASDTDQLGRLNEASLIYGFEGLRKSYDRIELGLYFLGLVEKVSTMGSIENQGVFDLLGNALKAAETSERLDLLRVHFQIKLLGYQGVLPAISFIGAAAPLAIRDHAAIDLKDADLFEFAHVIEDAITQYVRG